MERSDIVLVIDDEDDIREGMKELLESQGYAVALAANGVEGLEALEHARPFVILLDLMMPVMNGFEFLKTMRQRDNRVPVVALTAASQTIIPTEEVTDVVRKPIDLEQLLSVLERHSANSRLPDRAI